MKRQVFWLIFSCLTATNFLTYTMEEGDTPAFLTKEEDTPSQKDDADSTEIPKKLYPTINENQQPSQGMIEWICDDLKLISRREFKKYLGAQIAALLDVIFDDADYENFMVEAINDLYKAVDKDKATVLLLKLQEKYLPDLVHESIEDIRLNLITLLIIEKAIIYAEDYLANSEQNETNFLDNETVLGFIMWARPNLNTLSQTLMKSYQKSFPIEDEETQEKKASLISSKKAITSSKNNQNPGQNVAKEHIAGLNLRIKQLEKQLKNAQKIQPRSDSIRVIQGIIFGVTLCLVIENLMRIVCNPCVEHFEPGSSTTAFMWAFLEVLFAAFAIHYINGSASLKALATSAAAQCTTKGYQGYLLYKKAKNIPGKLMALTQANANKELNPWQVFENSLSEEQETLLKGYHEMLSGVCNQNMEAMKEFLKFYKGYKVYAQDLKNKQTTAEKTAKYLKFHTFFNKMVKTNKAQFTLFRSALEYIREQVGEKKK